MAWPDLRPRLSDASLDVLGEDVVYTPPGGSAQTVRAIFGERPVAVDGLDLTQAQILSSELFLQLRESDLAAGKVARGAIVVANDVEYEIRGIERQSDLGEVNCTLRRVSGA